jgi:hypothetical protein
VLETDVDGEALRVVSSEGVLRVGVSAIETDRDNDCDMLSSPLCDAAVNDDEPVKDAVAETVDEVLSVCVGISDRVNDPVRCCDALISDVDNVLDPSEDDTTRLSDAVWLREPLDLVCDDDAELLIVAAA